MKLLLVTAITLLCGHAHGQFVLNLTDRIAHVIESPNYPDPYGANQVVSWVVDSGVDWTVVIFLDISLESVTNCTKDAVNIRSFQYSWVRYTCEPFLNRTQTFVNPNNMIINFTSDATVQAKGFRGILMAAPANNYIFTISPTRSCTASTPILLAQVGTTQFLSLPNWPVTYPKNLKCGYTLSTPSDIYVVRLRRIFFDLGAGDKLDMYNAKDKKGRFCPDTTWSGKLEPVVDFVGNDDNIYIEFTSDSDDESKGYYLGYEAILKGSLPPTPSGCDNTNYILIIGLSVGGFIVLVVSIILIVWCIKTGRCKATNRMEEEDLPMPKKRKINPRRLKRMQHPKVEDKQVKKARPPRVITHTPRPRSTTRPASSNPGNFHDLSFQENQANGMSFPGTIDYV